MFSISAPVRTFLVQVPHAHVCARPDAAEVNPSRDAKTRHALGLFLALFTL